MDRTATNVVFLETKDRIFSTHQQVGLNGSQQLSVTLGGYTHSERSKYPDIAARLPIQQGNTHVNLTGNAQKPHQQLVGNGVTSNSSTNSLEINENSNHSLSLGHNNNNTSNSNIKTEPQFAGRNPVLDSPTFTEYDLETIATISEVLPSSSTPTAAALSTSRAARGGGNTDKAELKKKWIAMTKKATAMLNSRHKHNNSNASNRVTIVEVQALLDEVALLPNYTNSMSFAGASGANQEDEEVVNSSKMVIGELLKVRNMKLC